MSSFAPVSPASPSLSEITDGALPFATMRDLLTSPNASNLINRYLGGTVSDSAPQSMFDQAGAPLLDDAGHPIYWPWKQVALLNKKIMRQAGYADAGFVPEVAHLPLAIFGPIDIVLVTADGKVAMSLRSGAVENSAGTVFAAAAGSPVQADGAGTAGFVVSALKAQLGLDAANVKESATDAFPLIMNRSLLEYTVTMTSGEPAAYKGVCPGIGHTVAFRTHLTAEKLIPQMTLDAKYAGVYFVSVDDLRNLADRPDTSTPAHYYAAVEGRLAAAEARDMSLNLISFIKPTQAERLANLHRILNAAEAVGFKTAPVPVVGGRTPLAPAGEIPKL